ncbi:PREDICTED: protein FAF-like, chloroplastic isoform X2 [Lupinus angustifolius]|uniref:protein FAF-like, chloroplastic isoform X2 n=1 Tax=Lupinus angustifolius TaxID=3871 RepID=UPI00092E7DE4|nr:PREDICTED: protein FAF-like, chloroplastic isoform X2 [Lupinus angustifolius]
MTNMIKIQQGLSSSSLRIEEESNIVMMQKKHGTVTILGSNCDDTNTLSEYSSLSRTLSADVSSQKWLSHQTIKKVPSSEELMPHSISKGIADSLSSSSSEDEAEAERERLEIWSSIQRNKKEEQKKAGPGAFDMWNSLMSLKDNNEISKSLPVSPYIHPLVKRTKSCLSEKSLEICTENLGSETGSDGLLSSYPSETEEEKEEHHQQQQQVQEKEEKLTIEETKYNFGGSAAAIKKYYPSYRSFPPPLSSLSSSLHMRTHRGNGRLVLEAVSAPSNNNFCVQRQDGRLVLTLANHEEEAKEDATADDEVSEENNDDDVAVEELEEEFGEFLDEEGEAEDDVKDDKSIMLEKVPLVSSEITINGVHRLAMVMNKPIGLVNRNQEWSSKFNEVDVNVMEVEKSPVAKSLPPRPRVARLIPSTNFNAYEYYWKTKPTTTTAQGDTTKLLNSLPYNEKLNNNSSTLVNNNSTSKVIFSGDIKHMSNDQKQQLMVVREKNGDYKLVCNLDNSCKDSRRSLLFWEPYCIATS